MCEYRASYVSMGNEVSGDAERLQRSSTSSNDGTPSDTVPSPTKSVGRGSSNGKGVMSVITDDEFASFSTPTATPSASVRPSPSASARASPTHEKFQYRKSSESLQLDARELSFESSSRDLSSPPRIARLNTENAGDDSNDTLDISPHHALHKNVVNSPESFEDIAWMDPVLAAAAAGAASKMSRDALMEQSQSKRPSFPFRIDEEWREALQKLASTTKSTASSFAHVAAPVLGDAADTVKKSAIAESFISSKGATGENDDRERETKNDSKEPIQDVSGGELHGRLSKGDSRQVTTWDTRKDELLDDRLKGSFQRLASTTHSAAKAFATVAKPVLIEASGAVTKSVIDIGKSNEPMKSGQDECSPTATASRVNDMKHDKTDGEKTVAQSDTGTAQEDNIVSDEVSGNDWKESLERLASTTKSATASLSNLAAPIIEEATHTIQMVLPDKISVKHNEQGKYGGVGYRPIIRENNDGEKPHVEWTESLRRLASCTKSTAASLITVASPMVSESANAVIDTVKEATEAFRGSHERMGTFDKEGLGLTNAGRGSKGIEDRQVTYVEQSKDSKLMVSLDSSQDETIWTSPGWHDKKTPLRAHRAPPRDAASRIDGNSDSSFSKEKNDPGYDSPGSLASPGSIDTSKSLVSRTMLSSPEKIRRRDRDDCESVTSLSVTSTRSFLSYRRRGHREKNMLSSPGRFVEMVSKRLMSDSSGYPPTHGRGRKSSHRTSGAASHHRTSGAASHNGSVTPSPNIVVDRSMQGVFQGERQPQTPLSPPDSPQQSGSIATSVPNTPPIRPPQEVSLWDMVPESDSQTVEEGFFVIEPRPRIVLERAPDQFQGDDVRPGSTGSSEDMSLPMSTGFTRKRAYDSNDTASDPGKMPMKKHRKSRRASQLRLRTSRGNLLPPTMSPSSSAIFGDFLNLDTRSTFEEMSPGSRQGSEVQSPDVDGDSKISDLPDIQDKMLDEALMAFSSLEDIDFLGKISKEYVPESLQLVASLRWRQLTANWEHDETMKAITMRPCSVHFFNDPYQYDERSNDWSTSWTTTIYGTNRDTLFSLYDEFRKSRMASPSMANLSGFHPLLLDTQFQYLTPYLAKLGAAQPGDGSTQQRDHGLCVVLKHSIDSGKEIAIKSLLASAIAKSASYTSLIKQIATFATNNADPLNPASAVRYSVDVKTADAIMEKAKRKYKGDVLQVKDVLRGQIIFPNESSLACAITSLNNVCNDGKVSVGEQEPIKIARIKNLFVSRPARTPLIDSLPTGYRHILITLKFGDGFLAGKFGILR